MEDIAAAEAARNATNAVKSVTLPVTVPKVVLEATVEEEEDMVEEDTAADMEEVARSRLATPAAAMDTCHATVLRVRNATTVSQQACGWIV